MNKVEHFNSLYPFSMCVCVYIHHENVFYTYYCEDIHVCLARKRFSTCIYEKCFDKTTMYLSKKLYFSQDTSLKFPEYEAYISATVIVSINNGAILFFYQGKDRYLPREVMQIFI